MKNIMTLSLLPMLTILLAACGPQATAAPASNLGASAYGSGSTSATAAPVVAATDTAAPADNSGYGSYGNSPQTQPTTASSASPSDGGATLSVGSGSFLVDAKGMTLYLYTRDSAGTSVCSGGCANNWPPLTVTGQPSAGAGINASLLGTTTRADGSTQVTYNGHPLYYYKSDTSAGDENGQGVGGAWYIVSANGDAMK
jgi:predicted lipoprotein with Yx(FWY)xxD motif